MSDNHHNAAVAPMAEPVWPVGAILGEGPVWVAAEQALWFTDIEGRALHRYHPASGAQQSFAVGGRPGFVVATDDGGLLVGIERALVRLEAGRLTETVAEVDSLADTRLNDATVDPSGRLWFGSMDLGLKAPTGHVHLFDGAGPVRKVGGRCPITNGPAVTADGRTLYHVDTIAGIVWAYDIDGRETLDHGRPFLELPPADRPDGVTLDSEGCLWVGMWGGWEARRYDPDGRLMLRVPFPCANVTKVAFGGDGLATGYATTARQYLDAEARAAQPLAGALFTFEAPAPGLPAGRVRLRR